jgi:type IV pilus assembly protein PilA
MSLSHRLVAHALVAGIAGTASAGPPPATYGPLPPEALALPAETGMMVGVDTAALFGSALYKELTSSELPPAGVPGQPNAEIRDAIAKGIRDVEEETGVNPERDVDRAVMGVAGLGESEPAVVGLLLGRFDAERVARAVQASAKHGQSVTRKPLHGQTLLVAMRHGKPESATVVIGGKCLIFGTVPAVEATLASWAEGRGTLAANARLVRLVSGLDPASSLWLAVGPSFTAAMRKRAGPQPPPFPIPDTWTLTARVDGGFESVLEMPDEAAARNMADVVRGGIAAIKMQTAQAASASRPAPWIGPALEAIQVAAVERRVVLSSAEGAGGTAAIGVMAAIAVPALLRARVSANEAATIGDTRTVISAEAAYASAAQGYGSLSCLAKPASCLAGYRGPTFLDEALASATQKSGYDRAFHPGPAAGPGKGTYRAFAYVSTPREPGKTGVRSFCGDSTGRVCFDPAGAAIVPRDGLCPASCTDLR